MWGNILLGTLALLSACGAHAQTAMLGDPCEVITRSASSLDASAEKKLRQKEDWADLCQYAAENAALRTRPDVVFIGDSLTEEWKKRNPSFFSDRVLNRGISGQTSAQVLLRFVQDAVALRPRLIHVLVGTNDIAGNTGPTSVRNLQNAVRAMADLARANGIVIVFGSVLPADSFRWAPSYRPAEQIREINAWLRGFAALQHSVYVDYHAVMSTPDGAMRSGLSDDGVHPNETGYAVMNPLARSAISRSMQSRSHRRFHDSF